MSEESVKRDARRREGVWLTRKRMMREREGEGQSGSSCKRCIKVRWEDEKQMCSERKKVLGTEQHASPTLSVITDSEPLISSFKESTGRHIAKPDMITP